MKRVIIFDFFGVICSEIAPVWIKKRLPNIDESKFHEEYIIPVDLGKEGDEKLFNVLSEMSGISSKEIRKEWAELITINAELVSFIKKLKSNNRIALCSNAWSGFIRPILDSNDLNCLFETIIISSEIGCIKPNKEIYLKTLKNLGIGPEQCVFVDDNLGNLKTAKALGMKSVLFKSLPQLKEDLSAST